MGMAFLGSAYSGYKKRYGKNLRLLRNGPQVLH